VPDALGREDLIRGLRSVVAKLEARGEPAGIRIVGGAAIALCYFERGTTADIDAQFQPEEVIREVAMEVAVEEKWPEDWLNNKASQFIPFSDATKWVTIYDDGKITISVADFRTLLAMKLNSSRPGRDVKDIANLLSMCGISNLVEAEALMDEFYKGDGISDKALRILGPIFEKGVPVVEVRTSLTSLNSENF